jgi:signal transduction histidine kinase
MRSAKTEPARPSIGTRMRSPLAWLSRLNVRLVFILAGVALIALLVSGIALSQILPGFFLDQAERRSFTAALLTGVLVRERQPIEALQRPYLLQTPELRNTVFLGGIAQEAANEFAQASVEITYQEDGSLAARAGPDGDHDAALRADGLAPDSAVAPQSVLYTLPIPDLPEVHLVITVRDPYTNRVATLQRVGDTLVGTGLAALLVSLLIGVLGARALTRPLARLRRTAGRLAAGQLDERSPQFGILEVDDLAHQFNVMADRLSESLRMLEADRDRLREFVADVSHELRTPIAALRAFTELQDDAVLSEEQRREFLERSREQIARLEWMSTNLLDLSRIDAGIFPMDIHDGDLRDPVRSVAEAHAQLAEEKGITLSFEVPTSPVMLAFDRERIVQLLSNLVGNALKFTPRGGEVVVALRETGQGGELEVRDSGPGIREDELPHVFDRFFRGTNVGDARASGSGLGLSIARSIAEMHGGRIDVVSAPERGATFIAHLPRGGAEGQ